MTYQFETGLALYGFYALCALIISSYQVFVKKQPFGISPWFFLLGIFVWGDGVIIGLFWTLAVIIGLVTGNPQLFWVLFSVYWIVRSSGEIIYWLLEQFAETKHNPPPTIWGNKWFGGESIWFIYQVFMQMVLICSIMSLLFALQVL